MSTKEPEADKESREVALLSPTMSLSKEGSFFFSGEANGIGLGRHIYTGGAWKPRKVLPHPKIKASVMEDQPAYSQLLLESPGAGKNSSISQMPVVLIPVHFDR